MCGAVVVVVLTGNTTTQKDILLFFLSFFLSSSSSSAFSLSDPSLYVLVCCKEGTPLVKLIDAFVHPPPQHLKPTTETVLIKHLIPERPSDGFVCFNRKYKLPSGRGKRQPRVK